MPLSGTLVVSPGTGAIGSPSNMVTAPSGPGLGSIAQSHRGAEPPPLHLSSGSYRIKVPERSRHPEGSGHPEDWTCLKHSTHLQPTREQVLGDAVSAPGQEMKGGRSSSGLGVGSESARRGQTESGGNPPAWDFICISEKGVEEPQEHTLCLPSQE